MTGSPRDPEAFLDVVRTMRTHRAFTDDPVDDDTITRIVDAATFAPSAENLQPWRFVAVRDAQRRAQIGELNARAWRDFAREYSKPRLDPAIFDAVDRGAGGGIAAAPVLIVVGGDTQRSHPNALTSSIFPAVENLLLTAHAFGLGSALTTLTAQFAGELRAIVGFPDTILPLAVVPIGHPVKPLGPPRREPVADLLRWDRWTD